MTVAPFHADFVGSFLRPEPLKTAREQHKTGKIDKDALLKVENEEVVKLVNKLVSLGLKDVSDGEFKRSMWQLDFQTSLLNVKHVLLDKPFMRTAADSIPLRPEGYEIVGKVEYNPKNPFFDSFLHLKSVTPAGIIPKVTIPSPTMFYVLGNPLPAGYKSEDELTNDISVAYNLTLKHFYEIGCRYLQIDDCQFPKIGGKPIASTGSKPVHPKFTEWCVKIVNDALKDLPADFYITHHLCRGNYQSDYFASNPYNDEMTSALAQLNITGGWFLEFDDERSAGNGFAPLAKIAANGKSQRIVLGLITSKRAALEKEEDIIARIEEAGKFFPKERLGLSAQCGFASCEEGNKLTEAEQWAKVELIVRIAKKVWGSL